MNPTLCLIGSCNGAGKTTLAFEVLPRMGIRRFLNADEIARGLSPLDPGLAAFRAGRLVLEEIRTLLAAGSSFALESTLSGKTYAGMLRQARERGYRVVLHYLIVPTADKAVDRVALRVSHGGHAVPEEDVRLRFERSRKHFLEDYLPLADAWSLWDNSSPPAMLLADSHTHTPAQLKAMLDRPVIEELFAKGSPPEDMAEMTRIWQEASKAATAKMLDYYKRMGIRVTPQMTLAPEPNKRERKRRKPAGAGPAAKGRSARGAP